MASNALRIALFTDQCPSCMKEGFPGLPKPKEFGKGDFSKTHAVALHGLQVIPFLAWLGLFTTWAPGVRLTLVLLGATGYAGLVAITLGEGLGGRALFENGSASLVLLICAAALLAAFVATLVDLTRGRAAVARS